MYKKNFLIPIFTLLFLQKVVFLKILENIVNFFFMYMIKDIKDFKYI